MDLVHNRHRLRHEFGPRRGRRLRRRRASSGRECSTIRAATRACCSIRSSRTWRGRIPPTTSKGCASRWPARCRPRRPTPGFSRDRVIGIGVDTTGSTPLPVDAQARPLALDPRWKDNLAAHAWLWKDHTSRRRSGRDHRRSRKAHAPELLAPIGGTYSSEWWWSKIWRCLKVAPEVFDAAASWVELADFVPAVLAGVDDSTKIVRCICAAGHKAMYSEAWGGLPPKAFPRAPRSEARRSARSPLRPGLGARPARRAAERATGRARSACRQGIADRHGRLRRALRRGRLGHHDRHAGEDHRHLDLRLRDRARRRPDRRHPRHLRHRQRLDHARTTSASKRGSRRSAIS